MEYLKGGSLDDKINNMDCGYLKEVLSLRYFKQLLEGVEFLHNNKIYHSDIKPANILFTSNDDIKLCDFGIAVCIHTDSSTSSYQLKGTAMYMSPKDLKTEIQDVLKMIFGVSVLHLLI